MSDVDELAMSHPMPGEEIELDLLECSPQAAALIAQAEAGEWTEICPDELIAQLEAMLVEARARDKGRR